MKKPMVLYRVNPRLANIFVGLKPGDLDLRLSCPRACKTFFLRGAFFVRISIALPYRVELLVLV